MWRSRRLRRLHRSAGIGAALFLSWLALSGVALNHSAAIGLDERYVTAPWLLDRYGIAMPPIEKGFPVADTYLSLVDGRLYRGTDALTLNIDALTGAVAYADAIVISDGTALLVLDGSGDIVEEWPLAAELGQTVTAIASSGDGIALRTASGVWRFDWATTALEPLDAAAVPIVWSEPEPPAPELVAAIASDWRGRGLTWERLLLDFHSGRFAGPGGSLLIDLAAVALGFLAASGVWLWLRR